MNREKNMLSHVAIIMDGNRRWSDQKSLPHLMGHQMGYQAARRAVQFFLTLSPELKLLTLFAFSSDNWKRSEKENMALLEFMAEALQEAAQEDKEHKVRICFIGSRSRLPVKLKSVMQSIEQDTAHHTGLTVCIAIDYSGTWDVEQAVRQWNHHPQKNNRSMTDFLQTSVFDPPDLLIRSGGECRLSNFMLLPLAYTELYFLNTLWPDVDDQVLMQAVQSFRSRSRRFGYD